MKLTHLFGSEFRKLTKFWWWLITADEEYYSDKSIEGRNFFFCFRTSMLVFKNQLFRIGGGATVAH